MYQAKKRFGRKDFEGVAYQCYHAQCPGDDCYLFYQFLAGDDRVFCRGGDKCLYGFDIWNPWITGAFGTLWNWFLSYFVDF